MIGAGVKRKEIRERRVHPALNQIEPAALVLHVAVKFRATRGAGVGELRSLQDFPGVDVEHHHVIHAAAAAGILQ